MEVIDGKSWNWMLFADDDRLFLSVVCGGVGIYEIDIELTSDEVAAYRLLEHTYLDQLAQTVRSKPTAFDARRLPAPLSGTKAKQAVAAWRQRQTAR